jgi:hypothetical protein
MYILIESLTGMLLLHAGFNLSVFQAASRSSFLARIGTAFLGTTGLTLFLSALFQATPASCLSEVDAFEDQQIQTLVVTRTQILPGCTLVGNEIFFYRGSDLVGMTLKKNTLDTPGFMKDLTYSVFLGRYEVPQDADHAFLYEVSNCGLAKPNRDAIGRAIKL